MAARSRVRSPFDTRQIALGTLRMAVLWFYGRGSDISGPVSGPELSALAADGQIVPTDTVWQDGIELGVPARDVPDLFPPSPVDVAAPEAAEPAPFVGHMVGTLAKTQKRGRAVAGKGAMIISQDGTTVKFRMKCTTCGQEDASWKSIPIPHGVARSGFYCKKCRKRRDAEINGYH
jgi:hypothetical protein